MSIIDAAPIQNPVTGSESLGDLSQPLQALAQFYRALNTRDLALMEASWDNSEEASIGNSWAGSSGAGRKSGR